MPTRSQYFVTFIDDATRKVWVYTIKSKDETFACFQRLLSSVENQSGKKVKALRSDNGGEYISKQFADFWAEKGIKREFIAPYTPAQNGVAERMNCTIQERLISMLSQSHFPQSFWVESLMIVVYLINRMPNASLQFEVPKELWSGHPVSYHRLRTFVALRLMHMCLRSFVLSLI